MSGLAPSTVLICLAVVSVLGLVWLVLKLTRNPNAGVMAIVWFCAAALCLGYLAIDKLIGVGYTKGFYVLVSLTIATGLGCVLALRRAR